MTKLLYFVTQAVDLFVLRREHKDDIISRTESRAKEYLLRQIEEKHPLELGKTLSLKVVKDEWFNPVNPPAREFTNREKEALDNYNLLYTLEIEVSDEGTTN